MKKINPCTTGFSDLPGEVRDIIYSFALPRSTVLRVHDNCPPFDPARRDDRDLLEISGISFVEGVVEDTNYRVRSNLLFVNKLISEEIQSVFFQNNTFEFSEDTVLTRHIGQLRSTKDTQLLKYRVASAIGSLKHVSPWIKRIDLSVIDLSAASMFWLCQYGVPELQRTFPKLVAVSIGFGTVMHHLSLRVHEMGEYIDGHIADVAGIPGLPPREQLALVFEGVVKSLWGDSQNVQKIPPQYPEILRIVTQDFTKNIGDTESLCDKSDLEEVTLTHWQRIFKAMGGDAPNARQPSFGNEVSWEIRVWRLLQAVIRPSWGVQAQDTGDAIDWVYVRPALQ